MTIETHYIFGLTVENARFDLEVAYPAGAPAGTAPLWILGRCSSPDGGGEFIIRRCEGGWRRSEVIDGTVSKHGCDPVPNADGALPWVIVDGFDEHRLFGRVLPDDYTHPFD